MCCLWSRSNRLSWFGYFVFGLDKCSPLLRCAPCALGEFRERHGNRRKDFRCMINKSASVVRQYSLFQDKLVLKISIDEVEVLQIVVDTATLDFSTTLCDCSLDLLANETTLAVKLLSHFHDLGVWSKGE